MGRAGALPKRVIYISAAARRAAAISAFACDIHPCACAFVMFPPLNAASLSACLIVFASVSRWRRQGRDLPLDRGVGRVAGVVALERLRRGGERSSSRSPRTARSAARRSARAGRPALPFRPALQRVLLQRLHEHVAVLRVVVLEPGEVQDRRAQVRVVGPRGASRCRCWRSPARRCRPRCSRSPAGCRRGSRRTPARRILNRLTAHGARRRCLEEEVRVAEHHERRRPVRVGVDHVERLHLHRIGQRGGEVHRLRHAVLARRTGRPT